ncbi:MAG: hypothetical protein WCJ58_05475 [bacterium]
MIKNLNYSNPFFKVDYVKEETINITGFTTITNLSVTPIKVDFVSSILIDKSCFITAKSNPIEIKEALITRYNFDPEITNPELHQFCIDNWDNNKVRYPEDPSKWNYPILRSPIEKFDKYEFNCWYLPANTASSIHNEHLFTEVHTQIYGLGIMNKFRDNRKETLYQRVYMPIGFTHDYFYDNKIPLASI